MFSARGYVFLLLGVLFFFFNLPSLSPARAWVYDSDPPTAEISVLCHRASGDASLSSGAQCDGNTATITISYTDLAGGSGLKEISHTITADGVPTTDTGCTPTLSTDSASPTMTCTYTTVPDVDNSKTNYGISASATDWALNLSLPTTFPFSFATYGISGNVFTDTDGDGRKDAGENNYTDGSVTIDVYKDTSSCSGTHTTITSSNGAFDTGLTLTPGTYTVCYSNVNVAISLGYFLTHPTGTPLSRTVTIGSSSCAVDTPSYDAVCGSGSITMLNFGIVNSAPTCDCRGGDCDVFCNPVLSTSPPPLTDVCRPSIDPQPTDPFISSQRYLSVPGPMTKAGVANGGIVFFNDRSYDPAAMISNTGWVMGGFSSPYLFNPPRSNLLRTSYSYLKTSAQQAGIQITSLKNSAAGGCGGAPNCQVCLFSACSLSLLPSGTYEADSGLILAGQTIGSNKSYVLLVPGDLTIGGEIRIPIGSTALFSAQHDILVNTDIGVAVPSQACDPTVDDPTALANHSYCNLEGTYSADHNFVINGINDCSSLTKDKRINISGTVVVNAGFTGGGTFISNRNLCGLNNQCPAYTITERPDFILNAPTIIKHPNYIWREAAP